MDANDLKSRIEDQFLKLYQEKRFDQVGIEADIDRLERMGVDYAPAVKQYKAALQDLLLNKGSKLNYYLKRRDQTPGESKNDHSWVDDHFFSGLSKTEKYKRSVYDIFSWAGKKPIAFDWLDDYFLSGLSDSGTEKKVVSDILSWAGQSGFTYEDLLHSIVWESGAVLGERNSNQVLLVSSNGPFDSVNEAGELSLESYVQAAPSHEEKSFIEQQVASGLFSDFGKRIGAETESVFFDRLRNGTKINLRNVKELYEVIAGFSTTVLKGELKLNRRTTARLLVGLFTIKGQGLLEGRSMKTIEKYISTKASELPKKSQKVTKRDF